MKNKFLQFSAFLFLLTFSVYGQTGKVVGKVTDYETKEALIGANVLIEGTSLGAATNLSGEYVILNVPPGTYTLKARYVGYQEVTLSNIRVSTGLTTEVDFALPTDAFTLDVIDIVAQKPLINKNITNSTNIVRSEDIENLPVRGVNAIIGTQAGVVTQGGNIYVRGSRADQVAFYIDGVLVNDPVFGGSQSGAITNAIEEIQFQAGGYSAEFGGANAGIISTQTKSGGETYKFGAEIITDRFSPVGEKFLGTYSQNFSEYVLTLSGPVMPSYKKLRFFIAGNNTFQRSPAGFFRGLNYSGLFDSSITGATRDTFNLIYPEGYRINQHSNNYQVQGNLTWDLNPINLRLSGSLRTNESRSGVGFTNYRTANRAGLNESYTGTGAFKFTHVLSNNAFYDVIVNYFDDYYVTMDPIFKHNIALYGDSAANAAVGTNMRGDGIGPRAMSYYGFTFTRSDIPFNGYRKQKTRSLGGKANLLYQIGKNHEFKIGGEFNYYTIRRYSIAPVAIASLRRSVPDDPNYYKIYNRLDNYGYDVFGNQVETGIEAPKNPVFAAFYIQDKMEFSDLVVNFGLRLDYIDIDGQKFVNPGNIQFTADNQVAPSSLVDVPVFKQISPRLGFSFPVTDRTVFHAQYGKFVQQSRLRDVYQGGNVLADNIKGGFAISEPVGFGLDPERTTQYEIGFKQQIGENFAFDITGFYKDIKDQVQIRSVFAESGANHQQYYAWVNGDFSTVKGIELKFDLRRTQRVAASLDYTYSDAQGTGSNPSSGFRQIWQSPTAEPFFPQQITPLDFNQTHRGFLNIDYRFGNNDGPTLFGSKILENFGVNALFSFNSGFNYTRWDGFGNARTPTEALNASTTPWTFQLDFRVDKTVQIGPLNTNIYVWIVNVLNTQNVVNVFNTSGDAYDDGFLASDEGKIRLDGLRTSYGEDVANTYASLYRALNYSSGNFGTPRLIRLGIRLNY